MGKYADFHGLASRSEYWAVIILTYITFSITAGLASLFFLSMDMTGVFLGLSSLSFLIVIHLGIILATTARRCRDAGINPWWTAVLFVPGLGLIATLVFGIIGTKIESIS